MYNAENNQNFIELVTNIYRNENIINRNPRCICRYIETFNVLDNIVFKSYTSHVLIQILPLLLNWLKPFNEKNIDSGVYN